MKQLVTYLFLIILLGCNTRQFDGIQKYESIALQHSHSLKQALEIIKDNSNANGGYQFICPPEEPFQHSLSQAVQNPGLCKIFQECNIKEAVRFKGGTIHLIFNRLVYDQNYGAYLAVYEDENSDTVTNKFYSKRISNSSFYLKAETDW